MWAAIIMKTMLKQRTSQGSEVSSSETPANSQPSDRENMSLISESRT